MMKLKNLVNSWKLLPNPIRWIGVVCVGGTLVLAGIVFLVLPGPGLPLIIAGLAVLATEFVWAEVVLGRIKEKAKDVTKKTKEAWKRSK